MSQYTLYLAMFTPLHSIINEEQHKKKLYKNSHYKNTEDSLMKMHAPTIDMPHKVNVQLRFVFSYVEDIM